MQFQTLFSLVKLLKNSSIKFQFSSIPVKEIRDAMAKIKTTKAFGKDNISCYFLQLDMPFIEKSLAHLFNTSIETSHFLDLWKFAKVGARGSNI